MKKYVFISLFSFLNLFIYSQDYQFNLDQEIFTNGANDTKYFEIDGSHYLAIAEFQDNTSVEINSTIYKWNTDSSKFSEFQEIATLGASDWEFFSIENKHYLAVANYRSDTSFTENSVIYKWNGYQFTIFQEIETKGAYDWEYFEIDNSAFLAIANQDNGSSTSINSYIYKWNGIQFIEHQTIATKGATDWKAFSINGNQYLAIANVYDLNSKIYKWNGNQFTQFQVFNYIFAVTGVEFFQIENDYFLALSRGYGTNFSSISKIYKWNGSQFSDFQDISSFGAFDFEYFKMNNEHYLALANYQQDTGIYNLNSELLKWNGSEFENFQNIFTHGAVDFEYFEIADSNFLMISEYKDSTQHNIHSRLFKFLEPDTSTIDTLIDKIAELENEQISLYPNPTSNILNIYTNNSGEFKEIRIMNLLGEILFSKNYTKDFIQINLNKLSISKGNYLIQIKNKKDNSVLNFTYK